jgi:hypothetical protein
VATYERATIEELLEAVSPMHSVPRLYSEGHWEKSQKKKELVVMLKELGAKMYSLAVNLQSYRNSDSDSDSDAVIASDG